MLERRCPHWIGFHDRDIAMDNGCLERLLKDLGSGVRYMSGAECTAYLHSKVERAREESLALKVDYDPHNCRAFAAKDSVWTLHLPQGAGSHVIR